jgi:hypothetical protein
MMIERIQWTCPVCHRRYAIPASAPKPSQCPQCRQDEVDREAETSVARARAFEEEAPAEDPLSALAAIQMEVVDEVTRGPAMPGPVIRRAHPTLEPISAAYAVLAGLAVLGSFAALLFGLRTAFVMDATPARTTMILEAIAAFGGGLIAALSFFTFRELIRVILNIEESTRPK